MSSSKKKILRQRTCIKDTELEELVVNGLRGVEVLAKADKWDGQSLLATPIHRLAGSGHIASSEWCLMVAVLLYSIVLEYSTTFADEFFYQGKAAPIKMKASLLWAEVKDKDLYFSIDFPKIEVFR